MASCRLCGKSGRTISSALGYCGSCIRDNFNEVWPAIKKVHDQARLADGLPADPPRDSQGRACGFCGHECRIPEGGTGYCGLRRVENGTIKGGRPHEGNLSWYYDRLPTNCVGSFICPGGTGCGYPKYSVSPGPEYGRKNLAVFYQACSFNCLYCQNHQYRRLTASRTRTTAAELAAAADQDTTCICYFGGDPSPQILHALRASDLARKSAAGRVMRICWETNGGVSKTYLDRMAAQSFESGGLIKFDLKAWHDGIHQALCGVSNRGTLENVKHLAPWINKRSDPPFFAASTLLVPGYVDAEEVRNIAGYLASVNPDILYSLLAFYPTFLLRDLPATSRVQANQCYEAAKSAGLKHVHLGNVHLLA